MTFHVLIIVGEAKPTDACTIKPELNDRSRRTEAPSPYRSECIGGVDAAPVQRNDAFANDPTNFLGGALPAETCTKTIASPAVASPRPERSFNIGNRLSAAGLRSHTLSELCDERQPDVSKLYRLRAFRLAR